MVEASQHFERVPMMGMTRRAANSVAMALCAVMMLVSAPFLGAQEFPAKVIRIATAEAGGGSDFMSRILAKGLSGSAGWQVIVDNKPGAGIVSEYVARSTPDGYTLLLNGSTIWLGPLMLESVRYDPERDFLPVTMTHRTNNILVVHPGVSAKTVKDLIDMAKAGAAKVDYASANLGSTSHLSAELFNSMAGVSMRRIPYKGTSGALTAVMSGEVQVMFASASSASPLVRSGKLRGLAVTSEQPSELFPDLPTVASTVKGYEAVQIYGVFVPARTPQPVINRLNQELVRVIKSPEYRDVFRNAGVEAVGSTPEYLGTAVKADIARMGKLVREAGIKEQ